LSHAHSTSRRSLFVVPLLAGLALAGVGCKEDGSSWAGTYIRYNSAVRNAQGKRIVSASTGGNAKLVLTKGQAVYDLNYGPNNATNVVQVYTFTKDNVKKVKNGYDVALTWKSIEKKPANAGYFPDNVSPLLKVRGKSGQTHVELEFTDTKGIRGDIDFSVGGKNLTGTPEDEDFDLPRAHPPRPARPAPPGSRAARRAAWWRGTAASGARQRQDRVMLRPRPARER
jgi:hypothetical protein